MRIIRVLITLVFTVLSISSFCKAAEVKKATMRISADPRGQYELVKKVMSDAIKARGDPLYFLPYEKEAGYINLYYCGEYSDLGLPVGLKSGRVNQLFDTAYDIEIYRNTFLLKGYPKSVWNDFLVAREKSGLAGYDLLFHGADTMRLKQLASILNSYRNDGHKNLPKVVVTAGCGAGGVSVSFRTDPPGGRVLLVPKMFHALCKAQGIDPDDERKCDFWHEVYTGQEPEVSGDYFAKLVWPDRAIIRSFSATELEEGSNKVTLR